MHSSEGGEDESLSRPLSCAVSGLMSNMIEVVIFDVASDSTGYQAEVGSDVLSDCFRKIAVTKVTSLGRSYCLFLSQHSIAVLRPADGQQVSRSRASKLRKLECFAPGTL